MAILIVGGSGYVGLHLLHALAPSHSVAFTYHGHAPGEELGAQSFRLDLATGQGFDAIVAAIGIPKVVINCAAISIPRACELDPDRAMAVNVPASLLQWMASLGGEQPPLLVHFSTDQVYEGSKAFYTEEDETKPLNVYGRSKLDAEKLIRSKWRNYVILRCSIIYGPQPFVPVAKSLPIQWMDKVLSQNKPVEFFYDEYRCPIFISDLVSLLQRLVSRANSGVGCMQLVLNAGGPDRLSRADMASTVAKIKGYNPSFIVHVSAKTVDRGVASPADISMNVTKLSSITELTTFEQGARLTLG